MFGGGRATQKQVPHVRGASRASGPLGRLWESMSLRN